MQQQHNPYHYRNLSLNQIKIRVMLFLPTHHMNSPQMNQTAFQYHHSTHLDLHRAHGALQRVKTQT